MPDNGFVAVPQVMLLGLLAVQLFHLGLLRQARARIQQAHERARQLAAPVARAVAIWFDGMLEVRLGNADRVAALAREMATLVDEAALAQVGPPCQWYLGWVEARSGKAREGFQRIRKAYEANVALGMISGGSEILRRHGTKCWALVDICEHAGGATERTALARLLDQLPELADTTLASRARALVA